MTLVNTEVYTRDELTNEEYHSLDAIGSSQIEDFVEERRLFEGRYITKTVPRKEVTDAMRLGTALHMRLLEPEKFYELLADPLPDVAPDGKKWLRRKGSDHEYWWAEELKAREGKLAMDEDMLARVEGMCASVLSKRWAHQLLEGNLETEYSIIWTDAETGLRLKCRIDGFRVPVSFDIKTTEKVAPKRFVKTAVGFGYHRRKAHYLAGISAHTGEKEPHMVHIAVGSTPPFSCGAYDLNDFDKYVNAPLGRVQWRNALRDLAKCIAEKDFSDPWEHSILQIDLPAYAFTESSYM